ncbi:MAG TPA: ABC transporter ATP-binding protein [Thermomicrobiales bacterium]|nr:ABC transporter ATP-binding protein [Thermomicrobiales bacterium]
MATPAENIDLVRRAPTQIRNEGNPEAGEIGKGDIRREGRMPDAVLTASAIAKAYRRRAVLRGVDLRLAPGTLVGIVGENGAGKSTLLRILAGDLAPDRGTLRLRGALGYCPQGAVLNDALTVAQHLDYFRAAYRLPTLRRADELLERLNLERYRQAVVGTLSGGTKQKLNLTLALMHRPTVLLLDEPYQGFDWETYLRFWDLAAGIRDEGGAVLVISHLFFDRERFDRLYQLKDGVLAEESKKGAR